MRHAYLLGHHIAHSLSPAMHNAGFQALGLDIEYGLLDVDIDGLAVAFARVRQPDCVGVNVTMPYKPDAATEADERSPEVDRCGVANLLLNRNGRLAARNVDIDGIVACLERRHPTIASGPAVVLGSGGAAAAVLEALRRVPPKWLIVCARNLEAADELIRRIGIPADIQPLTDAREFVREAALLVNTTPLGMKPDDPLPVPQDALTPGLLLYDLVYTRSGSTPLQAAALEAGALVCDGLTHVYEQAIPSFRLFTGQEPPAGVLRRGLVSALRGREPLDWGSD